MESGKHSSSAPVLLTFDMKQPVVSSFLHGSTIQQGPPCSCEVPLAQLRSRSMPPNAAVNANCRVYVHCTAGLGRAPAVCIGWLYWFGPYLSLDDAYDHLTSIRPCGPKKEAIRGATYDILDDRHFDEFFHLPDRTWAFMNEQDKQRLQQRLMSDWWR